MKLHRSALFSLLILLSLLGTRVSAEARQRSHLSTSSRFASSRPDSNGARALSLALHWLANHQSADGHWCTQTFTASCPPAEGSACGGLGDPLHDVGVTSLALLALMGDGNTPTRGVYKQAVRSAVKWLQGQQDEESGLVGEATGHAFLYNHAIATSALCEASSLESDEELRKSAARAVNLVLRARNPYGAWRYDEPPMGENDTSMTGWMTCALASAEAAGIAVDSAAYAGAAAWIDEVTDPGSGRVGYDSTGSLSSRVVGINEVWPAEEGETMTAVGLFLRHLLNGSENDEHARQAHEKLLLTKLPAWNERLAGGDYYYWYWGTLAMHQSGGAAWQRWNEALSRVLLDHQRSEAHAAGSWDPSGPWGWAGGRVYSTALAALCLEAPYRFERFSD